MAEATGETTIAVMGEFASLSMHSNEDAMSGEDYTIYICISLIYFGQVMYNILVFNFLLIK